MFLFLILAAFLLFSPQVVISQTYELPPLEVVSSPIVEEIRLDNRANQVTIVTENQIDSMNALDLASALRRVPGITISRYNLVGSYGGAQGGAIFIRGMGSERPGAEIMTLIDGRPVFQGIFTHPLLDLLSVDIAERIEIYKNPQPVKFGNMSFGAVNIITKRKKEEGFETRLGFTYGEHNTLIGYAGHGGKVKDWDYYIIGSYKKSDGHRDDADGELKNYFLRISKQFNKMWDFTLTGLYSDNWADDPGPTNLPKVPVTPRFTSRSKALDFTVSNKFENLRGFIKFFIEDGDVRWRQYDRAQRQVFNSNTDWKTYGVKIEENINPLKELTITVGFDYLRYGGKFQEIRPTTVRSLDDTFFYNIAPYFHVDYVFDFSGVKLIPSFGARYNISKDFDSEWGFEGGVVLRLDKTDLHFRYARGFNLPGVYVVYNYLKIWNQGDKWKDLKPEFMNSYEAGISHQFTDWLKGTFTAFWNYGKDRFVFVAPPPRFENREKYRISGQEITFSLTPLENLEIFFGLAHLNPDKEDLPYTPELSITTGANLLLFKKLALNLDMEYVSSRYVSNPRFPSAVADKVGSYFVINGKVDYKITEKNSPFESHLFLAVENLNDKKYEFLKNYPAPGRTFLGGIKVVF